MKKFLCILLILSTLLVVFASCGKKDPKTTTPKATTPEVTTPEASSSSSESTTPEVTTPSKWEVMGAELAGIDEATRSLLISISAYADDELESKCVEYMQGPDALDDQPSTIQRHVFNRNAAAVDKLGVTLNYVESSGGWGGDVKNIVAASENNDADPATLPDLFVDMVYDISGATAKGAFRDILSIEGSYLDYTQEGWLTEYMESMSLTGDRMYLLASDYFIDVIRTFMLIPFNMTMMDENTAKIGSIITTETPTESYPLSNYFFDLVKEGGWTYDVLKSICEAIHVDVDNSGTDDYGDVLGFIVNTALGFDNSAILYSTDIETTIEATDPITGEVTLSYPTTNDAMRALAEKIDALFKAKGTHVTSGGKQTPVAEGNSYAAHVVKFASSTLLFGGIATLGSLEGKTYADMEDLFSVVPLPLVTAGGEYRTLIHNIGNAGGINIASKKFIPLTAFLQYVSENSSDVRYEYQQIVMKYKVTEFTTGTSDMLDLIYDSVVSSREKMIDDAISQINGDLKKYRFHFLISAGGFQPLETFDSSYEAALTAKQAALQDFLETWYKLPTANNAGGGNEETPAE